MSTKAMPLFRSATPKWLISLRRFWLSPLFFALLLFLGCTFTALSLEVVGALTFLWIMLAILVTSDDAFAALVPFLLLTVLVSVISFKERFDKSRIAGVIIGLIGILCLSLPI